MNRDEKCGNRSNFDQEAVLKFYISNSEQDYGQNDTDNKRTEEAYKILDSYWKGDTIVLLDRLFADKVSQLSILWHGSAVWALTLNLKGALSR